MAEGAVAWLTRSDGTAGFPRGARPDKRPGYLRREPTCCVRFARMSVDTNVPPVRRATARSRRARATRAPGTAVRALALGAALLLIAAASAAAQAPTVASTTVRGPAGVRLLKPPVRVDCGDSFRIGLRFTAASRRAGVRSASARLGSRLDPLSRPRTGTGWRRVTVTPQCGRTLTLTYKIVRSGGRRAVTRRFTVTVSALAEPGQPGGPAPVAPGGTEPGGPAALPGAEQPAADGSTYETLASLRTGGPRKGQTCAQVTVDNAGRRAMGIATFCGRPELDAVFARAVTLADPFTGASRTVVGGVVDLASVASVAVEQPGAVQTLALSPAEDSPGVGGEFVAVLDGAVPTASLTLVVTRTSGEVLRFADPTTVNLRTSGT